MDILAYFPEQDATPEDLAMNECKVLLTKLANRGFVDTLQHSYFEYFIKSLASLCNINWLMDQIENLKSNDQRLLVGLKIDLVDEFKKNMADAFNSFLVYDDDTKKL